MDYRGLSEQAKQASLIRLSQIVSSIAKSSVMFEKGQMSSSAILSTGPSQTFKGYLAQLRELTMLADGLILSTASHKTLLQHLLHSAREMPDRDVERKISRICIFLVASMINSTQNGLTPPEIAASLFDHLNLEVIKGSGSRQAFAIKALSQVAYACGRMEESINTISQLILRSRYPTHRKVMLIGQKKADREYDVALQVWSAVMASFRSLHFAPPPSFDDVLFTACQSEYPVLARHGLALIASAARHRSGVEVSRARTTSSSSSLIPSSPSPASPGSAIPEPDKTALASKLLSRLRVGGVNLNDPLGCSYLLKAASAFASSESVPITLVAELFDSLYSMLQDKIACGSLYGAKVCSDLLQSFTENDRASELKAELSKNYVELLSHLTQAVERYVLALEMGSIAMPVILRSAAQIGRVMLSDPNNGGSAAGSRKDKETALDENVEHLLDSVIRKFGSTVTAFRIAQYPHAFRDALQAIAWLLPNTSIERWSGFDKLLLSSSDILLSLGEHLSLGIFDSIFERVILSVAQDHSRDPSKSHSGVCIHFLLHYASNCVTLFGSTFASLKLGLVWEWISKLIYGRDKTKKALSMIWRRKLNRILLVSLRSMLDQEFHVTLGVNDFAVRSIRARVFALLAEHVFVCYNLSSVTFPKICGLIVDLLLHGTVVESGPTKLICLQSLSKVALRLHVITRLLPSRANAETNLLHELTSCLSEMGRNAKGTEGLVFRPGCTVCCIGVSTGNAELKNLWASGILPLPQCAACSGNSSWNDAFPRMLEVVSWLGSGQQDNLGSRQTIFFALRRLEDLKAAASEKTRVDEQEEASWRQIFRDSDGMFEAWRSTLLTRITSESVNRSIGLHSIISSYDDPLEGELTVTLQPPPPIQGYMDQLLELEPPPTPSSPAPAQPPKPQREPPPPLNPAPLQPPKPMRARTTSQNASDLQTQTTFVSPPTLPTVAPPISPQPSFDAFDAFSGMSLTPASSVSPTGSSQTSGQELFAGLSSQPILNAGYDLGSSMSIPLPGPGAAVPVSAAPVIAAPVSAAQEQQRRSSGSGIPGPRGLIAPPPTSRSNRKK